MARYEFTINSLDENAVTSVRSGDIDLTEAVKATKTEKKGKSTYTIAPGTATGGDVVIIVGRPAEQL